MPLKTVQMITGWFILATIFVIGGFDVWAYMQGSTEGTISYKMVGWAYSYPAFTFSMGFVAGHLFWPLKKMPPASKSNT